MENALEVFAARILAFEDQFLAGSSEGSHWYLGDNFSAASGLSNEVITCIAKGPNPHHDERVETCIYILTQGKRSTRSKAVYRLPIDDLDPAAIMRSFNHDLIIFESYGLTPIAVSGFRQSIEALVIRLQHTGWFS